MRGPLPEDWFTRDEKVPMTKEPVKALVASLLSPLAGSRVLEIGAGTGGVTIELLRGVGPSGFVTSVESSQRAFCVARENVERSGLASGLDLVCGAAPGAIPRKPYDAVFVGGHGPRLEDILRVCWERMEPEGRLLVSAISPQTTARTLDFFDAIGVAACMWRVQASVGRKVGSAWLLNGQNPIDLIWSDKNDE